MTSLAGMFPVSLSRNHFYACKTSKEGNNASATRFASRNRPTNIFCGAKTSQGGRRRRRRREDGFSVPLQNGRGIISTNGVASGERSVIDAKPSTFVESSNGIGIMKFLRGKNILVTGTTGFLAKAVIEKLLREIPDIGKIYVLIRAVNKDAAMARLKSEIIDSELFACLRERHQDTNSKFFSSKLVPIVGDLSSSNLGIDANLMKILSREVDVIINSAANTTFDDRYDTLVNANTRGPSILMSFAKKCEKLCLLVHVSTMYVNGERKGLILEKSFHEGESIAMERVSSKFPYPSYPGLDVEAEMKLAEYSTQSFDENATREMKELGLESARLYGWRNPYELTKAMGEMVINSSRDDIPVVIIRPSSIESSFKDPYPGWIQGYRMLDPLLLTYGKGHLPGFYLNPQAIIDIIPVDMVANTIIAATAKHGIIGKPGLTVYQVGSSSVNPLSLYDMFRYAHEHFSSHPFIDSHGNSVQIEEMKAFDSVDELSWFLSIEIEHKLGLKTMQNGSARTVLKKLERKCEAMVKHALRLAKVYEPYMFGEGRYENGKMRKLMKDMSNEERRIFDINIESLDWRNYVLNVHLPGVRKHVWKGRGSSTNNHH